MQYKKTNSRKSSNEIFSHQKKGFVSNLCANPTFPLFIRLKEEIYILRTNICLKIMIRFPLDFVRDPVNGTLWSMLLVCINAMIHASFIHLIEKDFISSPVCPSVATALSLFSSSLFSFYRLFNFRGICPSERKSSVLASRLRWLFAFSRSAVRTNETQLNISTFHFEMKKS